jgi:hypothetical protein
MNTLSKLSLRIKISIVWALFVAFIVFLSGYTLLLVVKDKRIYDLKAHSSRFSNTLQEIPQIRQYLLGHINTQNREDIKSVLKRVLKNDPFIVSFVLVDQYNPKPIFLSQDPSFSLSDSSFDPMKIHEVMTEGKPLFIEENDEYIIPMYYEDQTYQPIAHLWVHWKPEATWSYFRSIKLGIIIVSGLAFLLSFLLSYYLLKRTYAQEYLELAKRLGMICGSDYSERFNTKLYSSGISDLAVHLNRILVEVEQEKNKNNVLEESLRQIEKSRTDFRKSLGQKTHELEELRAELRYGLIRLFDLIWLGVAIIDEDYYIHYQNNQAERLLRFARIDDSYIVDERLRSCLSPLVRLHDVDQIDDVCVWPQPGTSNSVSCNIRSAPIPSGDSNHVFFLLLREESGYPIQHGSVYYSERLVFDILANESLSNFSSSDFRFSECIKRLEAYHRIEKGDLGPISVIRLTKWLKDHFFYTNDFIAKFVKLDQSSLDLEISLQVPENVLSELIDSMVLILTRKIYEIHPNAMKYLVLRASIDSKGKPVISLSLPNLSRKQASGIHDILNERLPIISEDVSNQGLTLDDLELEISYSLYRYTKQLLHSHVECIYSESKQLALLRMTIENHAFTSKKDNVEKESIKKLNSSSEFVNEFLNPK